MAEPLPRWDSHNVESLHAFANIALIAADLDGTFLDQSDAHLSQTLEHLRRSLHLQRYRVELTLATGRALAGVRPILKKLLLPRGIPLIIYNGSVVVQNRSFATCFQKTITRKAVNRILGVSRRYPVRTYAYFYYGPSDRVLRMLDEYEYVLGWSRDARPKCEFNGLHVDWQSQYELDTDLAPSAILIEGPSDTAGPVLKCLRAIQEVTCTRSNSACIEIRPKGSNKAVGLAAAAQALNLSRENILALGDNDNDSEMLAWAGIGVAIAGASPAAMRSSDYVCRHGVVQGAVEVLRLVKHARRYFFRPGLVRAAEG